MQLSNEDKETVIRFDETPGKGVIFTYNKTWQSHLEKKLGLKPVWENGYGGKEYEIDKKRIPMPRAPRKLSLEQRKKLGERLSKARSLKSPNPLGNHVTIGKSGGEKISVGKATGKRNKVLKTTIKGGRK